MLECMEILSITSDAGIRIYAIKGFWRLDETIQSRIIVMAFSMAAQIQHDPLSARTKGSAEGTEGLRTAAWTAERARQEQARSVSSQDRGTAHERFGPKVHREALQHDARQPHELDEEEWDQEAKGMRILWRIRCLCWV